MRIGLCGVSIIVRLRAAVRPGRVYGSAAIASLW
jgi:hypothetical protein